MHTTTRVFISATSADLASHRKVVKETLLTNDIHPVEQTNFPPDFRTVTDLLADRIRGCDAVICLVGFVFGAEPAERPPEHLRRSYTQLEFDTARRLGKPIYLFLAGQDCGFDSRPAEDGERQQLQLAHRESIRNGGVRWEEFSSAEQLRQRVAHIQFHTHSRRGRARENLPYPSLGSLFKGRDAFMEGLRHKLLATLEAPPPVPSGELVQRQVLCGLGGVGKTRLAVEYAARFKDEYTALLFVVADSPGTLRRNLASLTGPLVLNLTDVQNGPEEDRIAAALRWLADHPCWCLILDNVDDREAQRAVTELFPRLSGGHVLITSRLGESEWSRDVEPLHLDVLAPADARAFLLERTARGRRRAASDEADTEALLKELDGLALALEQAGAFIERQRCSIGDYLKRWKAGESRVREWSNENLTHYPNSLAVTWDTTMRVIGPEATALLRLLSWFAPTPVPEALLSVPEAAQVLRDLLPASGDGGASFYVEDALVELAAFSMVRRMEDQGEPCFSLHCVVQEITRKRIPDPEWRAALRGAVALFVKYAPRDAYRFEAWPAWRILIPHAETLWSASRGVQGAADPRDRGLPREDWSTELLDALALYYMGQDRNGEGIPLQRLTLELKRERLPADHPGIFLAQNDLALMLPREATEEKEQLYQAALEGRRRVHGEISEEAGETLHNYGCFLNACGQGGRGEPLMRQALDVLAQVEGPHHWRTLMAELSLARSLWNRGEETGAVSLARENLGRKREHLGMHHADTLDTLDFLAGCLDAGNDLPGAEALRREHVEGCRLGYGPAHRTTLQAMTNLGQLLYRGGSYEQALTLCRGILQAREQLLGPDHPQTLASLEDLAVLLEKLGRREESLSTRRDFVERLDRAPDAPPLSLRQVALDCYSNGHYDLAERLLNRVLELGFEVSGTHCHLARVLLLGDREAEAREHVAAAWRARADAPAYVVPRILWFQLLFAFRDLGASGGAPGNDGAGIIGRLKEALASDQGHLRWSMEPVLEKLTSWVSTDQHRLLAALVAALGEAGQMAALEEFAIWRESSPAAAADGRVVP